MKVETAQEALDLKTNAKELTSKDVLSLVSAAFMYNVLKTKLDMQGTLNRDEMSLFNRVNNWWIHLGNDKRHAVYEMGFRFSQGFSESTEKNKSMRAALGIDPGASGAAALNHRRKRGNNCKIQIRNGRKSR